MAVGVEIGVEITERKRKPDGSVREYATTLVHQAPALLVVRFELPMGGSAFGTPVTIPPGSVSFGFFWPARPYSVYRFQGPAGEVVAHRVDAVTGVRFRGATVSYRDLALDWWVLPDGRVIEEDRDEFEALAPAWPPGARAAAARAERAIAHRWRTIRAELDALAARF
jgi:Protein of unknown function (DUF402)